MKSEAWVVVPEMDLESSPLAGCALVCALCGCNEFNNRSDALTFAAKLVEQGGVASVVQITLDAVVAPEGDEDGRY